MKKSWAVLFVLVVLFPYSTDAFYDMNNFWTSVHEAPAWFESDGVGGFYGATVAGTLFTQNPVLIDSGVRMHKFAIGEAFFYISDKGVIRAENDLRALSIYFTLS